MRKTTLFLTGATGFLGGHFLKLAARREWRLRCLTRRPPRQRIRGVRWVRGDVRVSGRWMRELRGCDALVHLATAPLPECEQAPEAAEAVMVDGLRRLLETARKQGIARVVIVSSVEVYGSPKKFPVTELARPAPRSVYGFLKLCAETLALRFSREAGIPVCILRLANLYGRAANGGSTPGVLTLFAEGIAAGRPVIMHRSFRNSRDFLHVSDAARAAALAVRSKAEGVFNIGSGRETPLIAAARTMARLAGAPLKVDFRPREGRLRRMKMEIRKARQGLGFVPKVPLEQGLCEMLGEKGVGRGGGKG